VAVDGTTQIPEIWGWWRIALPTVFTHTSKAYLWFREHF